MEQMRQSMADWRGFGSEAWRPYYLALLAATYGTGEQVEEGLSLVAEALDLVETTGERFYEAELYRVKGEPLLVQEGKRQRPFWGSSCNMAKPRGQPLAGQIDEMVRRIVKHCDPEQIVLFGSRARGTAHPDSDVDLLVVMPVAGSKREKQVELRCVLHDICVPKDIIVVRPEELERRRDIVGTVIWPAVREGKVLYARAR
jgi:uncharacterized protein